MKSSLGDLATRVNAALSDHEETAEYPIEAVNDQGVITLSGTVPSDGVKDTAGTIAEGVEGVVEVVNDLEIREEMIGDKIVVPPVDPTNPSRTSNIP